MRRDATGQLVETRRAKGTVYAVRFRTPSGERIYETLGKSWTGMSRRDAEQAADILLSQVKLGIYRTRAEKQREREEREAKRNTVPYFGPFAEEWFERRCALGGHGHELSVNARADLRNVLDQHLLPWFAGLRLDEIDVEEVEQYTAAKRRERRIGATYLNRTLAVLRGIFRDAVKYRRVTHNPAEGVRVPSQRFEGSWLSSAEQIAALLDAAGAIDRAGRFGVGHGRALLSTLVFAGLRIDECLSLRWDDVNLTTGNLHVRGTKTVAAKRTVDLLPPLREELAALKARRDPQRTQLVFPSATGRKVSPSNVRTRLLTPAVEVANVQLAKAGADLIRGKVTPHSLRRTFASVLMALGRDHVVTMRQMGHRDPSLTLRVYSREMAWGDGDRDRLRALVAGTVASVPAAPPVIRAVA